MQQYEKRFLTEPEKRLFFCRGEFLYAMGYRGWIDTNSTPTELVGECIARELAQVERLLTALTRLSRYALVRFDFGPDALLSEIEVLPDMFGGPSGNIAGERWEKIVDTIAEAYDSRCEQSSLRHPMREAFSANHVPHLVGAAILRAL